MTKVVQFWLLGGGGGGGEGVSKISHDHFHLHQISKNYLSTFCNLYGKNENAYDLGALRDGILKLSCLVSIDKC